MKRISLNYINTDGEIAQSVCEYSVDGLSTMRIYSNEFDISKSSEDLFECFCLIRNDLKKIRFLCFGSHLKCYPSGMCRSMGDGLLVYYHENGKHPDRSSIKRIFDYDEAEDQDLYVSPEKQKEYISKWYETLS